MRQSWPGYGIAVGLVLSVMLARLVTSMLAGVRPADPVSLGVASLLLLLTAVAAALDRGWRARPMSIQWWRFGRHRRLDRPSRFGTVAAAHKCEACRSRATSSHSSQYTARMRPLSVSSRFRRNSILIPPVLVLTGSVGITSECYTGPGFEGRNKKNRNSCLFSDSANDYMVSEPIMRFFRCTLPPIRRTFCEIHLRPPSQGKP